MNSRIVVWQEMERIISSFILYFGTIPVFFLYPDIQQILRSDVHNIMIHVRHNLT